MPISIILECVMSTMVDLCYVDDGWFVLCRRWL